MCLCSVWKEHEEAVVRDGAADDCAQALEGEDDGLALLVGCRWGKCEDLLRVGGQVAPLWVVHGVRGAEGLAARCVWRAQWIDRGSSQSDERGGG